MGTKERNQNPNIGDEINLRLFTYNANQRSGVYAVEKVEIFKIDPSSSDEDNPEGRVLMAEFDSSQIEEVEDSMGGHYRISLMLESELYTIGDYVDVWHVMFSENQTGTVTNDFSVSPDMWYASDMPVVYDFSYGFRPNRLRKGEKRWLTVDVVPNVPRSSDLERYYTNLAIASPVRISIEKACGECVPKEKDLRLVVDKDVVEFRRSSEGYYFLDTVELEMDCGIYNVWFELEFGESTYISENLQIQVY